MHTNNRHLFYGNTEGPWGAGGAWHIDGHGYQHYTFSKVRTHARTHHGLQSLFNILFTLHSVIVKWINISFSVRAGLSNSFTPFLSSHNSCTSVLCFFLHFFIHIVSICFMYLYLYVHPYFSHLYRHSQSNPSAYHYPTYLY